MELNKKKEKGVLDLQRKDEWWLMAPPARQCTTVPVYQSVPVYQCTKGPVYQCTSVPKAPPARQINTFSMLYFLSMWQRLSKCRFFLWQKTLLRRTAVFSHNKNQSNHSDTFDWHHPWELRVQCAKSIVNRPEVQTNSYCSLYRDSSFCRV